MNKVGMIVIGIVIGMLCITAYQNWFCPGCRMDLLANKPVEAPVIAAKPKPENKREIETVAEPSQPSSQPSETETAVIEPESAKPAKKDTKKSKHRVLVRKLNDNDYLILRNSANGRRTWMTRNELSDRKKFKAVHFPKFNPYESPAENSGPMIWTEIQERGTTKLEWVLHIITAHHNCTSEVSDRKSCRKTLELWFGDSGTTLKPGNNVYWKTYKDRNSGQMHSKLEIPMSPIHIGIMQAALTSDNFYINYGEGDLKVVNQQGMHRTLLEFKRTYPDLKITKFRKTTNPSTREANILSHLQLVDLDKMNGYYEYVNKREMDAAKKFSKQNSEFVKAGRMDSYPKIHFSIEVNKKNNYYQLSLNLRSSVNACGGRCDGGVIQLYNPDWGSGKILAETTYWRKTKWKGDYTYETYQVPIDDSEKFSMIKRTLQAREAIIDYGEGNMKLTEALKTEMIRTIQIYEDLVKNSKKQRT